MNILLVCSAGMSTSMLVQRMRKAAEQEHPDISVVAIAESDLARHLEGTDVILLGPQVRYLASRIQKQAEPYGIKVDVINPIFYGRMDGAKVLEQAQSLTK